MNSRRGPATGTRILICALIFMAGIACNQSGDSVSGGVEISENAEVRASSIRVAKLQISGMTCNGCAGGVQKTLSELPGVINAVVSREDKTAQVTLSPDSATGEAELRAAVDAKGYRVTDCIWDS